MLIGSVGADAVQPDVIGENEDDIGLGRSLGEEGPAGVALRETVGRISLGELVK